VLYLIVAELEAKVLLALLTLVQASCSAGRAWGSAAQSAKNREVSGFPLRKQQSRFLITAMSTCESTVGHTLAAGGVYSPSQSETTCASWAIILLGLLWIVRCTATNTVKLGSYGTELLWYIE
jgi:hypothetical protein